MTTIAVASRQPCFGLIGFCFPAKMAHSARLQLAGNQSKFAFLLSFNVLMPEIPTSVSKGWQLTGSTVSSRQIRRAQADFLRLGHCWVNVLQPPRTALLARSIIMLFSRTESRPLCLLTLVVGESTNAPLALCFRSCRVYLVFLAGSRVVAALSTLILGVWGGCTNTLCEFSGKSMSSPPPGAQAVVSPIFPTH